MSLQGRSILRLARTSFARDVRTTTGILRLRGLATAPSETELKKTPLYDFHLKNEAKMVPFAGYSMPLLYGKVSQVTSHHHTRSSVSLFDVSHMVQSFFMGKTATGFLEWLTPTSLSVLDPFSTTLSVLLNEKGGIIDDLIIAKHNDEGYFVITNAGCRDKDLAWFKHKLDEWNSKPEGAAGPVSHKVLTDTALVALQGPQAASFLQKYVDTDLKDLTFGKAAYLNIDGARCHVMRGGYTGEDGFEIAIHPSNIEKTINLLTQSPVQLAGLGARDSLRLEAGMCLYGHDLNEDITPNVAMGYIKSGFHKKGTEVLVEVRKKLRKAVVSPMPFAPTNYYRG
ncbi:Aminomethyltransferase, mitochondrial [Tulasnella sp. 418]|nr:Aminomethyltransferase, mitochondrial [Tulasnella sp. 418]